MGVLRDFFPCFCVNPRALPEPSPLVACAQVEKPYSDGDISQGEVALDEAEDLLRLQREIIALSGTGSTKLSRLLAIVSAYANANASLFGMVEEGHFVLLATSQGSGAHYFLGSEPEHYQLAVIESVFHTQRPELEEFQASETGSTSPAGSLGALCAIPLFGGPNVAGALLLEAGFSGSEKSVVPHPTSLSCKASAKRARSRLFHNAALLHHLGLAVSVGLGMDGEQLRWLARALDRLFCCDRMNHLVWELCEDLAAHVKRRYIVESSVRAALLPRDDAPLGLLFHAHACSTPRSFRAHDKVSCLSTSARFSVDCVSPGPANAGQAATSPCTARLGVWGGVPSRKPLNALVADSTAASEFGAATPDVSKMTTSPQPGPPADLTSCARLVANSDTASAGGRRTNPSLATVTAVAMPPVSRAIMVQLPPHMAAEAPSASLHAQAFPLKHTALQAQACLKDFVGRSDSCDAAGGHLPFPGTVIEDVAMYLQNVHNPSHDVCLLLGGARAAGQPGSPRAGLGTAATASVTSLQTSSGSTTGGMPGHSACGNGGGGSGLTPTTLQSLVLVGLRLGESVLSFYLCFPKHMPKELLLAVKESCNELLGEVFMGPVRAKVEGSLAVEFETLRSTTPGHFAVLRNPSANGLVQRPGSHGSVMSARAARLLMAPQRLACGAAAQNKTGSSVCSEAVAATPLAAAVVVAAPGAAVDGGAPCASSAKLLWRPSMELCRSSPSELALFAHLRGAHLQRTVSFSQERRGGAGSALGGGGGGTPGSRCVARQASREMQHVVLGNDELLSVLLQMRHSEPVYSQGNPRAASITTVTVAGVDAAASVRQQMDMLVTSIQSTMSTEVNVIGALVDDLESLELLEVIGKGGGGVVYKGRLGTQEVAVKVMELPGFDVGEAAVTTPQQPHGSSTRALSGPGGAVPAAVQVAAPETAAAAKEQLRARRAMLRNAMEMAVQGRLSHPNLIQAYGTYPHVYVERHTRPDGSTFRCLVSADVVGAQDVGPPPASPVCCAIVAELADCGSLATALSARTFPRVLVQRCSGEEQLQHPLQLDLRGVYMTLLDVALALRHLHSLNLVHRDIKPANLLLKSNPRDYRGFTVKLADFGFVLQLTETAEDGTRYVMVDQACGTVTHMAPELLPGKARVEASADIYSFGILMWELVAGGVRPFPHLHPDHIPRHVFKGARPVFGDVARLTYRGLAQACWAADAHRRPKAADLVAMITAQMQELD